MARTPSPLPPDLLGEAFTVSRGREQGLTPTRLRAKDLAVPTSGIRSASACTDLSARTAAFARALPPDVAFSHLTAARLLGLPTPGAWKATEPFDVMRHTRRPPIARAGCRTHRGLEYRFVSVVDGLRVVHALDTWCDLACTLRLDDLVAVADVLLLPPFGLRPSDLARAAADRAGDRGVRALREAASLARAGSASPWESKARVAFHRAGLPEPELNADILDNHGQFLARGDFVWRRQRVVGEYDGDQHRTDRSRWQYERERRAGLEDSGWTYVELTSLSLTSRQHREALMARLRRVLL